MRPRAQGFSTLEAPRLVARRCAAVELRGNPRPRVRPACRTAARRPASLPRRASARFVHGLCPMARRPAPACRVAGSAALRRPRRWSGLGPRPRLPLARAEGSARPKTGVASRGRTRSGPEEPRLTVVGAAFCGRLASATGTHFMAGLRVFALKRSRKAALRAAAASTPGARRSTPARTARSPGLRPGAARPTRAGARSPDRRASEHARARSDPLPA